MGQSSTELFTAPIDRWDPAAAEGLTGRDEVLYRSHLVGTDPALTKEGGGNFSAKGTARDHCGEPASVLWMSAWGCDGARTAAEDFPALRLDDLLLVRDSGPMNEIEMVRHLVSSGLHGEQKRPGIETLTHAFIPAAHVDHCHPDAVIALTSFPGSRRWAEEEFGDEAIWFDYRQFDVGVARELADRIEANPRCRFVLMANHGLFTWADTSQQCYRNSLEAVERATSAVNRAIHRPADLGGEVVSPLAADRADEVLGSALPALRGALGRSGRRFVLQVNRDRTAVEFTSSARGPNQSLHGPSCPDHLGTVGYRPMVLPALDDPREAATGVVSGVEQHREWYDGYYERNITPAGRELDRGGGEPRVAVLPRIGVVSAGTDAAKARLCADHFTQTMTVIRTADAAGGYVSLTEGQGVADEYWPLIRLKPQLRSDDGPLAGRVVLVAGTDDRVHAVADVLAGAEAHVVLTEPNTERAAAAAEDIVRIHGERRAVAVGSGGGQPHRLVHEAVLAYGGFDVVVDMSGDDLVAAALPVLACQGTGGSILLVRSDLTHDELAAEVTKRETECAQHGVTLNAVAATSPVAISEAAKFFANSDFWKAAVLQHRTSETRKVSDDLDQ